MSSSNTAEPESASVLVLPMQRMDLDQAKERPPSGLPSMDIVKRAGRCVETYDVLPEEYIVSEKNPNPPILRYALPAPSDNVFGYDRWCVQSGNMRRTETIIQVLSDLCRHRIRLVRPFYQTKDAAYIFEIYTNYRTKEKQGLSDEKEEEILTMLRGELGLAEDVKPRWYFHTNDPRAPVTPEFKDEHVTVVFDLATSLYGSNIALTERTNKLPSSAISACFSPAFTLRPSVLFLYIAYTNHKHNHSICLRI